MPSSAVPEITVSEAEKRLGISQPEASLEQSVRESLPSSQLANVRRSTQASLSESNSGRDTASNTPGHTDSMHDSLPESLRNKRVKPITVSRTFRLPLALMEDLEKVAAIHDIPMVTILAEALEIHLARFPH